MERGVWVCTPEGLVPKHLYHRPVAARSDLSAPMIITDTMEPTWNPANGQTYDSKRKYEKAVRAAGCEIIGNEAPKASARPSAPDPIEDVKAAIEMVESRTPTKIKRKKRERV